MTAFRILLVAMPLSASRSYWLLACQDEGVSEEAATAESDRALNEYQQELALLRQLNRGSEMVDDATCCNWNPLRNAPGPTSMGFSIPC